MQTIVLGLGHALPEIFEILVFSDVSRHSTCTISKSTVMLHIRIVRLGASGPKILLQTQLNIYILTVGQYWLGIAKPKNIVKSILNHSIK